MKKRGFTIIELLVVVTVIIILLGLLTAGWEGAYTYAMRVKCQHHLEQIWNACVMYSTGHGNRLPQVWNWGSVNGGAWYSTLVSTGCLSDSRVTVCPSSNIPTGTGSGGTTTPVNSTTLDAVNKALNWLNTTANQNVVDANTIYWPGANGENLPGTTALGILAFLGAGHSIDSTSKGDPTDPNFGDTIKKALNYLISRMDSTGHFDKNGFYEGYNQGLATMAVCDALKMMGPDTTIGGRRLGDVAPLAASALVECQNSTNGAFPYNSRNNYNDNSCNIWGLQGIWAGSLAGLINIQAEPQLTRLNTFFALCTSDTQLGLGGAAYRSGGLTPPTGEFQRDGYNSYSPWRLTAATLAARLLLGRPITDTGVQNQLNWLKYSGYNGINDPSGGPDYNVWLSRSVSSYDLYTVYYMSLVLWKYGGAEWQDWSSKVPASLLAVGTPVGTNKAFWNTNLVAYGSYGGNVYPTALAAMSMEMTAGQYLPGSKYYVAGSNSYGYNELLGANSAKPSSDTIAAMDYMNWSVTSKDGVSMIAPRHGGRMNIIFTDGRCESFLPEEIVPGGSIPIGMLTPKAGD